MSFLKLLSNLPGWRTRRKIVVIESDDWGSIRMPSLKAYNRLRDAGVSVDKGDNQRFNTLDTLANKDDLEALYDTLSSFKDKNSNPAVVTPMALSANPDFNKIEKDNFSNYHYQSFFETLKDYQQENTIALWKQGYKNQIFVPEFHGREHLNVRLWMKALQEKDKDTLAAFQNRCWGFKPKNHTGMSFQAAFYIQEMQKDIASQNQIIEDGVKLFERLHDRKPKFFVPPNASIHQDSINEAVNNGMKYVSSPKIHTEPLGRGKSTKHFRYIGKKGKNGLIYITRNCFFEPSYQGKGHSLEDCLSHVDTAFKFRKPAVISSHRVNYVGGLNDKNRIAGNKALKELLKQMLSHWPDVEFMTSVELGDIIRND
jgi:hypothetical protein